MIFVYVSQTSSPDKIGIENFAVCTQMTVVTHVASWQLQALHAY
jgi:hypothetical protein